ncbi:MAG TPA: hypothetical protein VK337_14210 [Xanthobacteraceae bacterium]|nr:hypothetical protein [Xanthobacteraceae bacterium]
MIRVTFVVAAGLALAVALPTVSAHAQAARTYVSVAGTDNAVCGINSPCRHFQAAVTATAAEGEVDALDPGAYGAFTISHAITIEGQGWAYITPVANGAAITITAGSTDKISIHGVSLNGAGVAGGTGILLNSGVLTLQNSAIRLLTTGLNVMSTHADVIGTDFIGNGTAILTNGPGIDFGVNFPYPSATTLVRLNGGNFIQNTTAFTMNNVGTNTNSTNNRLSIVLFTNSGSALTNTGGNGTLTKLTGTPNTLTYNVGVLTYGFGADEN